MSSSPLRRPISVCERLEARTHFAATPALAGFVDEQVATGITSPTAMEFAPDGRLFVSQKTGALRVIKNGSLLPTPFTSLTVDSAGERGLLGIAFDPNYATNRFVYVYHTVPAPTGGSAHNRVTRFTADAANPDVAVAGSGTPILDLDNLSTATNHNGGAIHFGLDGKLYVAVGENATRANSQTLSNRLGKILRINPDGSIPTDNPFYNTATGDNRSIWALGLRNPYTFAFQPGTTKMYINDVGESTWEEVNVGEARANYGWGTTPNNIEGPLSGQTPPTIGEYRDPLHAYQHSGGTATTNGIAITGGAFYNTGAPQFPVDYTGDYFFADLGNSSVGRWIRKLEAGTGNSTLFATGLNGPVDLKVGPDGKLYYVEINVGRIGRLAAVTPAVSGVQINDGNAQRSMVNQVTVTFSRSVTLDPGAFSVVGRNGAGAGTSVSFTNPAGNPLGASATWSLSFSGSPVVGGSLADGIYDLQVVPDKVHDAAVPAQTLPGTFSTAFHRLFSDSDGDGDSDNADLFQIRSTYVKTSTDPAYKWYFDYDQSGVVDNADVFQVRSRRTLVFQGFALIADGSGGGGPQAAPQVGRRIPLRR